MKRKITFSEGYRLMKRIKADKISCVFMAFVWALRGDQIEVAE